MPCIEAVAETLLFLALFMNKVIIFLWIEFPGKRDRGNRKSILPCPAFYSKHTAAAAKSLKSQSLARKFPHLQLYVITGCGWLQLRHGNEHKWKIAASSKVTGSCQVDCLHTIWEAVYLPCSMKSTSMLLLGRVICFKNPSPTFLGKSSW